MPDNTAASRSRPSTKLRDILMSDKPTLSYADFHHQITSNADSCLPKSAGSQQRHRIDGKAKEDELVKYMSNLPSYLEKGKNFQGKPLNVGVLDWRRLEKWNFNNNPMPQPHKNSGYSSSTSSTSYFSTEGSSSHSSRGQSSSPARQRMHHSSLQSHLEASPLKTYSQDKCYSGRDQSYSPARQRTYHLVPHSQHQKVYPWESNSQNVDLNTGNTKKFDEIPACIPKHGIIQQKRCGMDQTSGGNQSKVRLEMCEKKESDSNTTSEIGERQTWGNSDMVSSRRGKLKVRESELKEAMQSRTSNLGDYRPDCSKHKTVVLLVPRDHATNRDSVKGFSVQDKEVHGSGLSSNFPYSCPPPLQEDSKKKSEMRESCSTAALGVKASSQRLSCPSRSRNTDEKKSIAVLKSSTTTYPSGELDNRTCSQSTAKVRHPSPIRRLGSAMGSVIRNAGSRDNSPLRRSSSNDPVAKPCLERAAASTSSDTNKSQANSRARSSPLRRLLDPLIKPKAPNVRELVEPLRKDTASTAGPSKSSDGQINLSKLQSVRAKSTFARGKTYDTKDSHQNAKKESSRLQALLQVSVKNGLPLFTFAADNDCDILAATLWKWNAAEKDHSTWLYTFFTVHEMKKKNALWPSQGSKCNGHYVPNVVAQMKVSDHQGHVGTRQKGTVGDNIREFTLFSVNIGQLDEHATEFQPRNELAAIVVKLLTSASPRSSSDMPIDSSRSSSMKCSLETKDPHSSKTPQHTQFITSQIPLSTTVILPGGVHTIPSKGSISTLTQRWRSGGSCDCGGWDLGCHLRTFTSQGESQKLTSSKTTNTSEDFKLFSLAGQESQLILSLTPFKDRIYSVEFDSSVSLLQAFATCVAVLDCRRPSGLYSTSNMNETKPSTTSVSVDPARMKAPDQCYEEVPASYVSYPPHSPVGRV